jgi:ribosomal protein S27E
MPTVPRPVVFFRGKGEKSMRVKCISCGQELNLDHGIFEDYSGPVKCFSCSTMMEVKSTGGEVYSINPLAVFETKGSSVSLTEKQIQKYILI